MDTVGDGAMSCSVPGLEEAGCLLIYGYNASSSHPIVSRRIVRAKEKGAKIIVVDPRVIETARIADIHMQVNNSSDIAFINAMSNVIVTEGLHDKKFIEEHTNGFDEWWQTIKDYTPENTQEITGIEPDVLRQAARMYATAEPSAIICWGMGVTQQKQNVLIVHSLAALGLITGQAGKPNSGFAPVRGQNNVQGTCDMGTLPNLYPGYQNVTDEEVRAKFAKAWNVPVEKLSNKVGVKLSAAGHLAEEKKLRILYNFGEDPYQTEPDVNQLMRQYGELDLMITQDIFMTQTAMKSDVILPATSWGEHEGVYSACDRTFQYFEAAVPPKGECRHDWDIFADLSTRLGYPMHYNNTKEIWDEMRGLCPKFYGATYEKMQGTGHAQWPLFTLEDMGSPDLFLDGKFNKPDGRGILMAHNWEPPTESPDDEYPLVLCTVREVGHYSCRSMTGNCRTLSLLAEEPGEIHMNPADAQARGIEDGELVRPHSRRGDCYSRAVLDPRINKGTVYMTYQWWIGKCNNLTIHAVDPNSGTAEDKYSACQVDPIEDQVWAEQEVERLYMELKAQLASEASAQDIEPGQALTRQVSAKILEFDNA